MSTRATFCFCQYFDLAARGAIKATNLLFRKRICDRTRTTQRHIARYIPNAFLEPKAWLWIGLFYACLMVHQHTIKLRAVRSHLTAPHEWHTLGIFFSETRCQNRSGRMPNVGMCNCLIATLSVVLGRCGTRITAASLCSQQGRRSGLSLSRKHGGNR